MLCSLLLISCFTSFSQEAGKVYHLKAATRLEIYQWELPYLYHRTRRTSRHSGNYQIIESSDDFTVIGVDPDSGAFHGVYVIKVLKFSSPTSKLVPKTKRESLKASADNLNQMKVERTVNSIRLPIYFAIPASQWTSLVEETKDIKGLTFGFVNAPMKIRFANSNHNHRPRQFGLDANVNLGLSTAYYLKRGDDFTHFLAAGILLTQIKVDAVSTNNEVLETTPENGISYFWGYILQKENYQIGILMGWDAIGGKMSDYWVYQKKPWIGLGIGLSIFTPGTGKISANSVN